MINHIELEYPELIQINLPDRRLYEVPGGFQYPSITTILGESSDKGWLEDWKERVGIEEANKVSKRATLRGTALHGYCEDYLNNKTPNVSIFDLEQYNQFKKALGRINNVYGIEKKLYSHKFQTAGTVDLFAEFDGILSICDWKTSKSVKKCEDIQDYFIQTSFYAIAIYEMFGIKIESLVIIMAVDGNREPLIFKEKPRDWFPLFVEKRKQYKQIKGI